MDLSMFSKDDIKYMRMAIALGKKRLGRTTPNPAVGAVVVNGDEVVGKGYHKKAGTAHAEVNALQEAGPRAKGATLYVTLEPCNHFGRTPPCTQAILNAGISRVVIGALDPNPRVAGGGEAYLRKKGVRVDVGCLEFEAKILIAPFVKHTFTGRPWIRAKVASTLDGKIATRTFDSKWITGPKARGFGHRLRQISNAIMVGRGTAQYDNPSLTCRINSKQGHDPIRVILDSRLKLSPELKVFHLESKAPTMVFCSRLSKDPEKFDLLRSIGVKVFEVDDDPGGGLSLKDILNILGSMNVQSMLVEGGSGLLGAFFDQDLVDEVFFFFAPKIMGGKDSITSIGGQGPHVCQDVKRLYHMEIKRLGEDFLVHGFMDEGVFSKCLQG